MDKPSQDAHARPRMLLYYETAWRDQDITVTRLLGKPKKIRGVDRQHRTDELSFYRKMRMYSLEDGRRQLARYQALSNDYIMTCLNFRSPNEVLDLYLGVI